MSELYVVFSVADAEYALPAAVVRQLESYHGATRVPGARPHVAGIVQIRGQVIPVIELRSSFGYPSVAPTLDTRVVVVEHGQRQIGLIVDRGREVVRIDASTVQTTPGLVDQRSRGLFGGLVQLGSRLIMLLDLRKVVGEEDLNVEFPRQLEARPPATAQLADGSPPRVARGDDDAGDQG